MRPIFDAIKEHLDDACTPEQISAVTWVPVDAIEELAAEIAAAAPIANRGVKRALARSAGASLDDQLAFEAGVQAETFESEDVREGLAAARERRPAKFSGR